MSRMPDLSIDPGSGPGASNASDGLMTARGRGWALARLRETLCGDPPDMAAAAEIMAWFGCEPDGDFQAIAVRLPEQLRQAKQAEDLQSSVDESPGIHMVLEFPDGYLILSQGPQPELIIDIARAHPASAAFGVGMKRHGITGAAMSIQDATRSAATAGPGQTEHFETGWLNTTILADPERFMPLFAEKLEIADKNPHLIETLRVFMELDRSKVRTAERLFIHAHTVVYRLERWKTLTGWDVATTQGLLMSYVAVKLFDSLRAANEGDADVLRLP